MTVMQRVRREGTRRQLAVLCPGCGIHVGLWMRIMTREEFDEAYPTTDLTAAENAAKDVATSWVQCLVCGYDGIYTFGTGGEENVSH